MPRPHQLLVAVEPQRVGRAEDVERPGLVVLLHQLQQAQRALPVQQEVLVHHEERAHAQLALDPAHDLEQLVAVLVEVDEAGPCRRTSPRSSRSCSPAGSRPRGSRVAAVVAACRVRTARPSCGRRRPTGSAGGGSARRPARRGSARNQATPSPRTMWSASISSARPGTVGDVPADDDRGLRLVLADQLAHLLHLADVRQDRADADHVVAAPCGAPRSKRSSVGKSSSVAGRLDVRLDQHQAPGAVEHAQRERRPARASPGCGTAPSG